MAQAYEQIWKSITGIAPATKLNRYTAVSIDANGTLIPAPAGKPCIGILREDATPVELPAQVAASGVSFCIFGDTVATGAAVEVGADGKLITQASGEAIGIAMFGGAADQIGSVLLNR